MALCDVGEIGLFHKQNIAKKGSRNRGIKCALFSEAELIRGWYSPVMSSPFPHEKSVSPSYDKSWRFTGCLKISLIWRPFQWRLWI